PAWASLLPAAPAVDPAQNNGWVTATVANGNGHANGNGSANGHGYSNGNGHAEGNGYSNSASGPLMDERSAATTSARGESQPPSGSQPAPQPPAPAAPVTVIRPRQRIQIARKEDQGRTAEPALSGPQYHLHITLCRSDDFDADVRCMQEVDRVLRRFGGEHKVSLYIPRDDCNVVLEPMHHVNPTPELVDALKTILGEGQVQLEGGR
ncbi:MAG TPA: hypothetical protein VE268_02385, partial [Herpetosiphonaceae bacterium]|nr:hypothetical protein [Herpetosiphonaceae bacterium]